MAVYVCLVRAIGPATHRVMSMAALRAGCEAAGLDEVATHGNTGNLICRSRKGPRSVGLVVQEVVDSFGIGEACEVFVRTVAQMTDVLAANPFPAAALERPQQVGVCSFHETPDWPAWIANHEGPQRLATIGPHLVVDYPGGVASGLDIERRVGARMTQRNWRVFASLADKAAALDKA